jgi:hypothetical protein
MKKLYFLFLLITSISFGQTTLNQGEVMLIGFNFNGSSNCEEGFTFVSYVDLLPTTEIRFSEEDFSQWGSGSEGDLVWTNTTGVTIPALTAITIITHSETGSCGATSSSLGSFVFEGAGTWALGASNEEIIIFQGTSARTLGTPISTFQSDNATDLPTGLNLSYVTNFEGVADDADVGVYTGPTTFTDLADFAAQITDVVNNWTTQDGATGNGIDSVYPDYPADLNPGFSETLGTDSFSLANSFKMYPNPVNGNTVTIISNSNTSKTVNVYDVFGKEVLIQEINETLNVSGLASGVYVVKITQDDLSISKKLVIK